MIVEGRVAQSLREVTLELHVVRAQRTSSSGGTEREGGASGLSEEGRANVTVIVRRGVGRRKHTAAGWDTLEVGSLTALRAVSMPVLFAAVKTVAARRIPVLVEGGGFVSALGSAFFAGLSSRRRATGAPAVSVFAMKARP
eukprot:4469522-Pleurochrysis_carterae.AAC.7